MRNEKGEMNTENWKQYATFLPSQLADQRTWSATVLDCEFPQGPLLSGER
jgi:hypothetical protein